MDALEVLRGLKYRWVTFGSMRSMAYQVSGGWRRGSWCKSVDFGEQRKGEERWEEVDRQEHSSGRTEGILNDSIVAEQAENIS